MVAIQSVLLRRQEYVAMGLYHLATAVSFINSDCKLVGAACLCHMHELLAFAHVR